MSKNRFTLAIEHALQYLDVSVLLANKVHQCVWLDEKVQNEVVGIAAESIGCQEISLFQFDPEHRALQLAATSVGDEICRSRFNIDKHLIHLYEGGRPTLGLTAWVARHPMNLTIEDVRDMPPEIQNNYPEDCARWSGNDFFDTRSKQPPSMFLAVPLIVQKRTLGILRALYSPEDRQFTSDDEVFLTYVASLLACAKDRTLRGARLEEYMKTYNTTIERIMDIDPEMKIDLEQFLNETSERLAEAFGASIVSIYLIEPSDRNDTPGILRLRGAHNVPRPYEEYFYDFKERTGTTSYIFESGEIVVSPNIREARHHRGRYEKKYYAGVKGYDPKHPIPFMGLPLRRGSRKLGVIKVEFPLSRVAGEEKPREFDPMDCTLFEGVANLLSFTIETINQIDSLRTRLLHYDFLQSGVQKHWTMKEWKEEIIHLAVQTYRSRAEAARQLGIARRTITISERAYIKKREQGGTPADDT